MMLDGDLLAVSPSTVYLVLRSATKLGPRWGRPSTNAKGFEQPSRPHEHWNVDFFIHEYLSAVLLLLLDPRRL